MTSLPPQTTFTFPTPLPTDRNDRWALLARFLAAWFPEARTAGVGAAALDEAEARLALSLPPALREWYALFGARSDVWCLQDELWPPGRLRVDEGFLTFCIENQGVVRWGIRVADLPAEDPPVFVSDPEGGGGWLLESKPTTAFALQFAAVNAKWSASVRHRANGEGTRDVFEAIERAYPRLPFADMHWPAFPTRFYGSDEIIMEAEAETWLWVTARNRRAIEDVNALVRAFGMAWEDFKTE